jgi:hypothetical protein
MVCLDTTSTQRCFSPHFYVCHVRRRIGHKNLDNSTPDTQKKELPPTHRIATFVVLSQCRWLSSFFATRGRNNRSYTTFSASADIQTLFHLHKMHSDTLSIFPPCLAASNLTRICITSDRSTPKWYKLTLLNQARSHTLRQPQDPAKTPPSLARLPITQKTPIRYTRLLTPQTPAFVQPAEVITRQIDLELFFLACVVVLLNAGSTFLGSRCDGVRVRRD